METRISSSWAWYSYTQVRETLDDWISEAEHKQKFKQKVQVVPQNADPTPHLPKLGTLT